MQNLATHLNAFATEVELTQEEWEAGQSTPPETVRQQPYSNPNAGGKTITTIAAQAA